MDKAEEQRRIPLPKWFLAWLCFRITMAWPIWLGRLVLPPLFICGWAGVYAYCDSPFTKETSNAIERG